MSQFGPRKVGEVHETCPIGQGPGVLVFVFRDRHVGESTGGVRGLPVYAQAIDHLRCDVCGAMYGSQRSGQLLTDYCRRRLRDCQPPPDQPTDCPCCPAGKAKLLAVYLPSPFDRFSVNVTKHGVDCLLCPRCGRLIWYRDYGAEEFERQSALWQGLSQDPK